MISSPSYSPPKSYSIQFLFILVSWNLKSSFSSVVILLILLPRNGSLSPKLFFWSTMKSWTLVMFGPWNWIEKGLFLFGLFPYYAFLIGLLTSGELLALIIFVASWLINLYPSLSKILIAKGCYVLSDIPLCKCKASSIFLLHSSAHEGEGQINYQDVFFLFF